MWTRTLLTASFCRFSARVSPACLIEKNIGPSSASHSEEEAGRGVEAAREDGGEEEARGGGKKRRQEEEARGGSKRRKEEEGLVSLPGSTEETHCMYSLLVMTSSW